MVLGHGTDGEEHLEASEGCGSDLSGLWRWGADGGNAAIEEGR